MAKSSGRLYLVQKNGATIAAVRSKSLTIDNAAIDVTNDDSNGFQTFLADTFATRSMSLEVSGVLDGDVLFDAATAINAENSHFDDLTIVRPNGEVVAATFILQNYSETGSHDGAVEFSASLVRSGQHTVTTP